MSNVVVFPKAKKGSPANSMDEILENIEATRKEQIEMLVGETLGDVFAYCRQEGFDLTSVPCIKTTALVVESLRAALYNTCNLPHALHDVAEKMFFCEEEALQQTERIVEYDEYED